MSLAVGLKGMEGPRKPLDQRQQAGPHPAAQPSSTYLAFLCAPPFPTSSRNANTEQCTNGKTESEDLFQDLIFSQSRLPEPTYYPLKSLFTQLALTHTDLQARTMSYELGICSSWHRAGQGCSAVSIQ